jgi:hypothetical protein
METEERKGERGKRKAERGCPNVQLIQAGQ